LRGWFRLEWVTSSFNQKQSFRWHETNEMGDLNLNKGKGCGLQCVKMMVAPTNFNRQKTKNSHICVLRAYFRHGGAIIPFQYKSVPERKEMAKNGILVC